LGPCGFSFEEVSVEGVVEVLFSLAVSTCASEDVDDEEMDVSLPLT
jgi:hypothetical protein